jgi:transposase
VPDNLASGVTKTCRYEPDDLNATYAEMAAHYGVAVVPARVRKPRDKAKVEAGVRLVERLHPGAPPEPGVRLADGAESGHRDPDRGVERAALQTTARLPPLGLRVHRSSGTEMPCLTVGAGAKLAQNSRTLKLVSIQRC